MRFMGNNCSLLQPQCVLWVMNGCIYYTHEKIQVKLLHVLLSKLNFLLYSEHYRRKKMATFGDVNVSIVLMVIAWRKYYYYKQQSVHCMSLKWKMEKLWFNLAACHDARIWRIPCGSESSFDKLLITDNSQLPEKMIANWWD